jgi:CheY-like chemotaxis protein
MPCRRGGGLRITLQLERNEVRRELLGGVLAAGQYVRLDVEDEGEGMPAAMLPRIFEPFYSNRQRGRGTGLGLAIAHRIVTNHGGALDVESQPGSGSRFTIYLPEHAGNVVLDRSGAAQVTRGNGETVLVVDDEPELVLLAEESLAQLGYEPVGYSSSERAFAAFAANPGRFQAVITDEVMPGISGTELCSRIREKHSIPILLVSGYGGEEFEARARASGRHGGPQEALPAARARRGPLGMLSN